MFTGSSPPNFFITTQPDRMHLKVLLPIIGLWSTASAICQYTISAYADQDCNGNSLIETFTQDEGNVQCHRLSPGYYANCYIVESISGRISCSQGNKLCLGNKDEGGIENGCTLPNRNRCVDFNGPVRYTKAGTANIFAVNP